MTASGSMGSLPMFMLVMLISGSLNTILMKFMVMQQVPAGPGLPPAGFDHPYFQSLLMMIGEFLCLIAYYLSRSPKDAAATSEEAPKHIFAVACMMDWTATTLVNMAYLVIAASLVQMMRGAIVIFTCILSVVFLGRRQYGYHILGVTLVFLGITLVSLSAFINPVTGSSASVQPMSAKMMGIMLCVGAQLFQASMIVYEERIMGQYSLAPLLVVGMEGMFGIIFGTTILVALNLMHVETTSVAFYQMQHSTPLLIAIIGSVFSIAFFNFSGVTVTQRASAVARSTIDVSRTIIIWAVELAFGWNSFNTLQLMGFIVLACGTMIYNRIIVLPLPFLDPPKEAELLTNKVDGIDAKTAEA
eukprot:TRINITY_DN94493_c0_g1_i1.p1 TRINITY_DN94493_c0_g1~~TRINITY_DN94493_c0_g1_i1.p1  ORF type:complete len:359 (-),score=93.35 TRINITY_DN94493_c0_g1_i1:51-1127(-)